MPNDFNTNRLISIYKIFCQALDDEKELCVHVSVISPRLLIEFGTRKSTYISQSKQTFPSLFIYAKYTHHRSYFPQTSIGVTFSNDGSWTEHVGSIKEKAWQRINILRSLKHIIKIEDHLRKYI